MCWFSYKDNNYKLHGDWPTSPHLDGLFLYSAGHLLRYDMQWMCAHLF